MAKIAKKKEKQPSCTKVKNRTEKGRFIKGVSGNPNGRQRSEWRDELEDAIRVVQGKKRKKLMIHIVEQAYKDNRVLVALLKKLLPDLKTGELNISGEISLKPPTIA